ncbi:MAG: DUF1989 domain-containing protein [Pseudomonadota bacterium]
MRKFRVAAGGLELFRARAGDLINITNKDGGASVWITSLPDDAKTCTGDALSSAASPTVDLPHGLFDSRRLKAIVTARNGSLADASAHAIFDEDAETGDVFTLKVSADCLFIAISPLEQNYIVSGGGASFHIEHQPGPSASSDALLPDPLGKVRDEWRVERGAAHAYQVKKGQFIQILDVEGQQCSDFMAMNGHALDTGNERFIDSTVSRSMARSAYPQPGLHDKFFDQDINPLLSVRQDTVGRHDTYAFACTARGYEERGFPGHINCSDNITDAYAPFGIKPRNAWPAINFFFNSWMDPHTHQMQADEAWSRPGDYVVMEALTDLVCVSTACPDDVDPINGWNPTDIHVRIYEEHTSIQYAVAHRNEPDDAARLTRHSPFHARTSKLTKNFHVAQDLWMPTKYDATGPVEEYWACKNAATLQDMSALRKFDVLGPDAEVLLQHCMTRDISKLSEHRGLYALMCDERGSVIDDGTLFRLQPAAFRWCCGSEGSGLHLREQAEKLGLRVWIKSLSDRMANLALQGPKSREILRGLVFIQPSRPALENVKWFGFTHARLRDRDGPLFMLTRSGFTGELGYELFCDQDDAEDIWDALMESGEAHGLVPMGSEALNMLRTEAGLMVSGAEFTTDVDALEAGLGFAVDFKKAGFLGKAALERNQAAPRRVLVGLQMNSNDVPAHGDPVFVGRDQVGIVTSASASPQLGHAIAMARIAVENSAVGEQLEVGRLDGHTKRYPCTVTSVPFIDAKREKPRS